jgi:hypothetical protein
LAKHLDEYAHSFGSIDSIMQIIHHQKKDPRLNTLQRFHIHKEAANDNHLNDNPTIFPNRIFDFILKNPAMIITFTVHYTTPSLLQVLN